MAQKSIKYRSKILFVHKAVRSPDFNSPTVLTKDPWEYVDLWLRRKGHATARFFWEQARQFYIATQGLPPTSAPLTSYYSMLNATKSMLLVHKRQFSDMHGVTGYRRPGSTSLSNEMVRFKSSGVHGALRMHCDDPTPTTDYSLKDVLYNLAFIHRAFTLTFSSDPELFIPVKHPRFVKKVGSYESWCCADIDGGQYQNNHVVNKLPTEFDRDKGLPDKWVIRMRKRFDWHVAKDQKAGNVRRLTAYHLRVRKHLSYIRGATRLWYIKRKADRHTVPFQSMTLIFAAAHRLSELARYSPDSLERHFTCQHNWLLNEFISLSLDQFIDEISSEITGQDFMITGLRAQ